MSIPTMNARPGLGDSPPTAESHPATISVEARTKRERLTIISGRRRRICRNRIRSHAHELGFHFVQLSQQLVELSGTTQLLILVDLRKHDRARLVERDHVHRIESAHSRILATKQRNDSLQPILLRLPLAQGV